MTMLMIISRFIGRLAASKLWKGDSNGIDLMAIGQNWTDISKEMCLLYENNHDYWRS